LKKTIALVSSVFLAVLMIVNYNYYLLGQKIVPVKIPVDLETLSMSAEESENFATDNYYVQLIVKIPKYKKWAEFEKALKEFQSLQKDSSVNVTVFENETKKIYGIIKGE